MQLKCVPQALLALRYCQAFSGVARRVQGAPRVVQALRSCSKCAHDSETASAPNCFGLLSTFARDHNHWSAIYVHLINFLYPRMITQQAICNFHKIAMAVTAVFEPQGGVNLLTKLPGVSVVQRPSIFLHTAQACKLHCPPVLVTHINDSHITSLATLFSACFNNALGKASLNVLNSFCRYQMTQQQPI